MHKILFSILLLVHGLIHFLGFIKAFDLAKIAAPTKEISRTIGLAWLLAAILFVTAAVLFILKQGSWWGIAVVAAILSQVLIITIWQDSKFGTIANIIILAVAIFAGSANRFENNFRTDVRQLVIPKMVPSQEMLTEKDLLPLPEPVQRYLRYAGVLNKPKVHNAYIVFEGEMREQGKSYFSFTSEQYNSFSKPNRLFFMEAKMFGMPVLGYHRYIDTGATMDIRLLGLFPVVQKSGSDMTKAETVTFLNDICLMAPAALIDRRISWQLIDSNTVKAEFALNEFRISAELHFNSHGQLINFVSEDRLDVNDLKQYPWSTPVKSYQQINGMNLVKDADAVWTKGDGDFVYGKLRLKWVEYNVSSIK